MLRRLGITSVVLIGLVGPALGVSIYFEKVRSNAYELAHWREQIAKIDSRDWRTEMCWQHADGSVGSGPTLFPGVAQPANVRDIPVKYCRRDYEVRLEMVESRVNDAWRTILFFIVVPPLLVLGVYRWAVWLVRGSRSRAVDRAPANSAE